MKIKKINVLSLFDGMSCGQLALSKIPNIKVNKYYASEVDKNAIIITKKNFPNTIHLGDVKSLSIDDEIDLIIGGSPCQNFSFGGRKNGMITKTNEQILSLEKYLKLKKEGFIFEGESYLFWEYIRILSEKKPKYFLLENVKMEAQWEELITNTLMKIYPDVKLYKINSDKVSGQNRFRLYWTNIKNISEICDKNIKFKDILHTEDELKHMNLNHSQKALDYMNRAMKDGSLRWKYGYIHESLKDKSKCLIANLSKGVPYNVLVENKKEYPLTLNSKLFRKLSPVECERLQTVPDNYTQGVSNTARYKMLGNGWTVDVISHILSFME